MGAMRKSRLSVYKQDRLREIIEIEQESHEVFDGEKNHINGIENFWNQAKRHMRKFNGVPIIAVKAMG